MIAFGILVVFQALISVVRLVIYATELRRRGERLWLWRFVDLPSGRLFNLNHVILWCTTILCTSCTFITCYVLVYLDFARGDGHARGNLGVIGAVMYIPLYLNGWLIGWGWVLGGLIILECKVKWAAKWSNWAFVSFVVSSLVVCPLMVAVPVVVAKRWSHVISQFAVVRGLMLDSVSDGTTTNSAILATIDDQVDRLRHLVELHHASQFGINIMYVVLAVCKSVLGMTALSAFVVVNRQLRELARDTVDPFSCVNASSSPFTFPTSPPSDDSDRSTSDLHTPLASSKEPLPTLSTFRQAPLPAPPSRNSKNLEHVKSKIVLIGANTVVSGLVFACVSAWAAPIQTLQVHGTTWAQREHAFFLLSECWVVMLTPVSVCLAWQAYKQLPSKKPKHTAEVADEGQMAQGKANGGDK